MMRSVLGNIVRAHIFKTIPLIHSDFEIAGWYDRSCNEIEKTVNLNVCIEELHKNFGTALTPN